MSKLIYTLAILFAVLLLLCAAFTYRERYVDIRTGRMRSTLVFGGFKANENVMDTELSTLWTKFNGQYPPPRWEQESKTRAVFPGASPHFGYHGAFGWQKMIISAF